VPDTKYIVYQLFIKALPDEGNGRQLAYPNIPTINWQEYTTNLTALQAAGVALIPFIDTVEDLTIVLDDSGFGVAQGLGVLEPRALETHVLEPRAPTYSTLPNSPDWLRLISQKSGNDVNDDYFYDVTQGVGSKIYIIDTGFFVDPTTGASSSGVCALE
jgi:hypothetical protein